VELFQAGCIQNNKKDYYATNGRLSVLMTELRI